jgi:Putative prokaryotic signal transducing protein
MKTLYEAANSLEAHMLVDLLKQDGLRAHIQGEHLQGAVGEIPAAGLIRLLIDEGQYDAARKIVDDWDKKHPPSQEAKSPSPATNSLLSYRGLLGLLIGLAMGVLGMFALYRTPLTTEGIDHNGDGKIDEKWIYAANGRPLRAEIDRNFDGKVDLIHYYNLGGMIEKIESDENFDGVYESITKYKLGNAEISEMDTDNDGIKDMRTVYRFGIVQRVEYLSPYTLKPLRVEYYKLGKLYKAELDNDKDGVLDTRQLYDSLVQITSTEKIQ